MKKQIKVLIYIIMAISLVACSFVGVRRIQTEMQYKDVEVALRYSDILRIAIEEDIPLNEVLEYYKNQGVTTLLVKETTVASAVDRDYNTYKGLGEIALVDGYILRFNYPNATELKPESRYMVTENKAVADNILNSYKVKGTELVEYESDGTYFLEIGEHGSVITSLGVGFDVDTLNMAADMGYNISLQVKSWEEPTEESYQFLMDEIASIKNVETIYFADSKVIGVTSKAFQDFLENYQLGFIEFSSNRQEGFGNLAKAISELGTNYKVVRLHTLEDPKLSSFSVPELMERYELALRERNNRVFLIKMPNGSDVKEDRTYLDHAITAFNELATKDGYNVTNHVGNYNLPAIPVYIAVLAGLASVMVFMLFMEALGFVKTGYVLGLLGILGYIGLLKFRTNLACQLMALFGSIMFPTYGIIKGLSYDQRNMKESILAFLKICVISFGGVLTTIGCLSRTNFALGINLFLGVKFVTVLPIVLVIVYLIFKEHGFDFKFYKGILDRKISYGSLLLLGILAIILYVYVSRTGNTGTASGMERSFRQFLDNVLGVRPRTKEFLISYPILLALLYYGYKERYLIFVIFGVIGPVSLVNTYGHIHTPILISLIRSGYGIVFGIIIGLILIGVIKLASRVVKKCQVQLK